MKKSDPKQDFLAKSLSVFRTLLERLAYLAELKEHDGSYFHWGFAREFGGGTANRVIQQVHEFNLQEFLRHPLPGLWEEVRCAAAERNDSDEIYLADLLAKKNHLLPGNATEPSLLHFRYELRTLLAIAQGQGVGRRRVA